MRNNFKIKTVNDGKLTISFKGADKRSNDVRFPAWCDYKSIKINRKELLTVPVATWHDKVFNYEVAVNDGQELEIEVEQRCHQYPKEEFKELLLKLGFTVNIDKITNDDFLSKIILSINPDEIIF